MERQGLGKIIVGCWFFILATSWYIGDSSVSYYIPPIFFSIVSIIIGIFEMGGNRNKGLYILVGGVLLALMWILSFILPFSPSTNKIAYLLDLGLFTLIIILMLRSLKYGYENIENKINLKN
jgi:hypothetical protein